MELLTKKELNEKLGKPNIWMPKKTINLFYYLGGVESFDDKIDAKSIFSVPNIADFEIRSQGLVIKIMDKFKQHRIGIEYNKIVSINLEDKEQIYEKKEKSVVGRAVVGGLLLGPLGALVGGMTGLKDGIKKGDMPDLVLSIEIGKNENDIEKMIMFSCKYDKRTDVIQFFKKNMTDKFSVK